jgi:hypothetical protein
VTDPATQTETDDRLIVSPHANHTVSDACLDPNFKGPDFVCLAEGLHCDTETHTVTPLCSKDITSNGFYVPRQDRLNKLGIPTNTKSYTDKIEWE